MKKKKKKRFLLRTKLVLLIMITSIVILLLNLGIYYKTDYMMNRVDKTFVTNVKLGELKAGVSQVHTSMTKYLHTKSTDALEEYYVASQIYSQQIEELNSEIVNSDVLLMEKNIRNLSENYISLTLKAVEAKRGRNVERYNQYYEESQDIFDTITTFIYSLNNTQFQENSNAYEKLLVSVKQSERMNLIIILAVGLLDVLVVAMVTNKILHPLGLLAYAADEVSRGNMNVTVDNEEHGDEITIVTNAFNRMLSNLNGYIQEIRENATLQNEMKERELRMEAELKDAQLKYLQAQINPHFLFNTLNAGVQLAMIEGAQRTYDYIQNVADFYRYNIKDFEKEQVTIKKEISSLDNYIYILNVRFSGEIQFEKKIDERYLNYRIPRMILQPIVENCVNHGIRGIDWQGKICLMLAKRDEKLCISISDNGIGMDQQNIERVLRLSVLEGKVKKQSNGVGLANVIRRLRLTYQTEDIVEITSGGENLGTEIAIYLPLEEEYELQERNVGKESTNVSDIDC